MSDYITEELVINILKRLPVKSLVKFRCVNKQWYNLITSSEFISVHLDYSIESNKSYPLVRKKFVNVPNEQFVLHDDDEFFTEFKELYLPFKHPVSDFSFMDTSEQFDVVGSGNGLICVSDQKCNVLYVWNPATREYVTISVENCDVAMGFGVDSRRNEYKIVRVFYESKTFGFNLAKPLVEVYELSSNAWRRASVESVRYVVSGFGLRVYLNCVVHWFAYVQFENGYYEQVAIASFDFSDEVLGEIMLPDVLLFDENRNCLSLSACGQSLALFHFKKTKSNLMESYVCNLNCDIWIMKEYGVTQSWSKLYAIDLEDRGGFCGFLSFRENGEMLIRKRRHELASYDPKTERITSLGFFYSMSVFKVYSNYRESLLSPKGLQGISEVNDDFHAANFGGEASTLA